ncbi:hypothetical protein HXX76_011335 [Chlamydomonas incerta]|uniref:Uncharacterized protein n=1 Tax=Chlamydomonas incerta TaxID=51695 RepID=A0A835SZ59_CHLIN|nr:hypothetical protein HXX76_011335 [Chlamydomonas incerta]|eukprot:KAG2429095.1 hypothetical protein HXX76_011335 [Chlamydomonas incerta]
MGGLLLLVAITALATVDARKTGFGGRHLLQSCPASNFCADIFTNCFDISCPNGILTVTAKNAGVTFQPDGRTNAYTCKSAYSWYACAQPGGASCTGVKTGSGRVACTPSGGLKTSGNGDYCNEPSVGRFDTTQATGLTDAVIQIHDGSFQGSASSTCPLTGDTTVEASGPCWSGGASDCKPPSPRPPNPNIAACTVPSSCPASSALTAAGIPNAACSTCTPSSCFKESDADSQEFETDPQRVTNRLFASVGGCIAKPSGTYSFTDPLFNTQVTAPKYLTLSGAAVHTFLASASSPAAEAVACYTDSSYATVAKYIYVVSIPTDTTNFACLTCSWFRVYVVAGQCRCGSDTAWAFPVKSVLSSWTAGQAASTAEIALPAATYGTGVSWAARSENSNAWGGYFRFAPAAGGVDTTRSYTFDMCAGCAQASAPRYNSLSKGYIMGKVTFTFTSVNGSTSSMMFYEPAPGASTTSSVLQVYQSYVPPPTMAPGQFQRFSPYTTPSLPFGYGATFAVTRLVTGAVKSGSTTLANVPATTTASSPGGVYVAIHMSVGGGFCDGLPAYN